MKKTSRTPAARALQLAAVGLEAEFELWLDGARVEPERVFRSPRDIIRGELMHRRGTSYHLPTGGAVYFDTGVVEIATPVIEVDRGCAARAGRSLWESILFLRRELDAWEERSGRRARLVGFSTHYNTSFEAPREERAKEAAKPGRRTVRQLARLLTYLLPAPVMLLATNRRSTGVGVRPRGERVEVTADFTPSSSLMIAAATVVIGIARQVMGWPSYELDELAARGLPVIRGFRPSRHTSRQGFLARFDSYPRNPFTSGPDAAVWEVEEGYWRRRREEPRPLSLRRIAWEVARHFRLGIRRVSDPFTFRLIDSVLAGRAPSLLDLADRPAAYEDVGRRGSWDKLFPPRTLARSRYERVLIRAISGRQLWLAGNAFTPVAMRGWSQVVFRREPDGSRHVLSFDQLLAHLDDWERPLRA
ncbi:MAG TPA: hypothetical protein VGV61_04615 [Thermoanaerobaculia bacterium]|jgi:hypothetical protein|nr:hypothetical protein [Thermoanaerobaculia bacterium]